MSLLNIAALDAEPLAPEPYAHVVVPNFVRADAKEALLADYPAIERPGSFDLEDVPVRGTVAEILDELRAAPFREAVERKFDVDLTGRPTTLTLRGMCGPGDGQIHTDSRTKIMTVLVYLNPPWSADGGRLRVLRGPSDLEDYAAEIEPAFGTLVVFKRSETSWHGHKPFVGPRRVVQLNWVTSSGVVGLQKLRHRVSAAVKRLAPAGSGPA